MLTPNILLRTLLDEELTVHLRGKGGLKQGSLPKDHSYLQPENHDQR